MRNAIEVGYRPPPESSLSVNHRLGTDSVIVVGTEPIPRRLIEEVVISHVAVQLLPASLKKLATKDELISLARLTTPIHGSASYDILTVPEFGRAIVLAHGQLPYGCFFGSIIYGKGCSVSGNRYPFPPMTSARISKTAGRNTGPIGFFGSTDSQADMNYSNLMLRHHVRVALPLGYLVISARRAKRHFWQRWRKVSRQVARNLIRNISCVEANGDALAYYVRVAATPDRIGYHSELRGSPRWHRGKAAIMHGANNLLVESRENPHHFSQYLGRFDMRQTRGSLADIASRAQLQETEVDILLDFLAGVLVRDLHGIHQIVRYNPELSALAVDCLRSKDKDYGWFSQDFETSINSKGGRIGLDVSVRQAFELVSLYTDQLASHRLVAHRPEPNVIWSTLEERILPGLD